MSLPSDYPRCKTCKWWGQEDDRKEIMEGDYAWPENARTCINGSLHMPARIEHGYDGAYLLDEYDLEKIASDGTATTVPHPDDEPFIVAPYWTGPDFGCVHWEAKEESNG